IRWRVAEFWAAIEADTPPPPDWEADGDVIAALYRDAVPGKVVDLTDSNRLPVLLDQYDAAAAQRRQWERVAKGMRAEILMNMGDAELALCGEWTVRASTVAGTTDRVVTEDMLGETLKGRSGYRGLHVSKRKGEEAA